MMTYRLVYPEMVSDQRKSGRGGGTACCCCCCCNLLLFASTEDSQLSQLWCFDQRKRGGKNQTEAHRERKRNQKIKKPSHAMPCTHTHALSKAQKQQRLC
jgi:hypothetical protein